jgi:hypothetical protein
VLASNRPAGAATAAASARNRLVMRFIVTPVKVKGEWQSTGVDVRYPRGEN